jgi:hypothetical protein
LRAGSLEGLLDFYVLLDAVSAWPQSFSARIANHLLPPNVGYLERDIDGARVRAKYAVLDTAQFAGRTRRGSFDTTIWARFCQPAVCVWARSEPDRTRVSELVAGAVATAAEWAAQLGPAVAPPAEYWRSLFARTYAAELRVEAAGRPADIVGKSPARYEALLPLAWKLRGIAFTQQADGQLVTRLPDDIRRRSAREWARRQRCGQPLNILRLLKAAFTFEGAMDYVAWKIERHRGVRIEVTPWQRRHPLLAAPGLYWRLRRDGIIR